MDREYGPYIKKEYGPYIHREYGPYINREYGPYINGGILNTTLSEEACATPRLRRTWYNRLCRL